MSKASNTTLVTLPFQANWKAKQMVTACNEQVATAQACKDYPNQKAVQDACKAISARTAQLDQTLTDIATLDAQRAVLEGQRDQDIVLLRIDHATLEAAINFASAGDKQAAIAWGAKPAKRTPVVATTDPPTDAAAEVTAHAGEVAASCKRDKAAICYLFQVGTDPQNPDAWPAPAIEGAPRHLFTGQPIGQTVYVRIAIHRRGTGQSPWSNVIAVPVH